MYAHVIEAAVLNFFSMMSDQHRIEDTKKIPVCPNCKNNSQVMKIIWGYPTPGLLEEFKNGNVFLGGCCPRPGIEFHCKSCKKEFGEMWFEKRKLHPKYTNVYTIFFKYTFCNYHWKNSNKTYIYKRRTTYYMALGPPSTKKMCSWTLPDQMWKALTVTFFDWSIGLGGDRSGHAQPMVKILLR